jgi:hypothetical protein
VLERDSCSSPSLSSRRMESRSVWDIWEGGFCCEEEEEGGGCCCTGMEGVGNG